MNKKEIRTLFLKHGYTETEAQWAMDHHLDPDDPDRGWQVKRILRNRLNKANVVMKYYHWTWERTIKTLEKLRIRDARRQGYEDLGNLFVGTT